MDDKLKSVLISAALSAIGPLLLVLNQNIEVLNSVLPPPFNYLVAFSIPLLITVVRKYGGQQDAPKA
jgi:hypothetical protein